MPVNRSILHLDLDTFFVSVERLRNSQFKEKPLIIGGVTHHPNQGIVCSCSYEARRLGIHPAMPIKLARRLCPEAIFINGDLETYQRYSRQVTAVIAAAAPSVYEQASIDQFYLDLTGMDRHFGCGQWSGELRQKVLRETGLVMSYGLSTNKLVAKMGTTEARPNGELVIAAGTEKQFIAPLAVRKIPQLGRVTEQKLRHMGVQTIKVLGDIPPRLLEREFGKPGIKLWKKANAIDHTPVVSNQQRKAISKEKTFQLDRIDVQELRTELLTMLRQLTFELRNNQQLAAGVTVKIRYADFNTFSKQKRIKHTADDLLLMPVVLQLFDQLYQRRQRICMIGIQFTRLVHGHPQINLFADNAKSIRLLREMDGIRRRFGAGRLGIYSDHR